MFKVSKDHVTTFRKDEERKRRAARDKDRERRREDSRDRSDRRHHRHSRDRHRSDDRYSKAEFSSGSNN